jgi:hypothetical protein
MAQKRHPSVFNNFKIFDLLNFFERRPINRINDLSDVTRTTPGLREVHLGVLITWEFKTHQNIFISNSKHFIQSKTT